MSINVITRPFSSELYTGLALPGGFFIPVLGKQILNAHVTGEAATPDGLVYVESVSDPNIDITSVTHSVSGLPVRATRLLQWQVDCSRATAGVHRVSFILETPTARRRIVKKIFVLGVEPDPINGSWRAVYPEGLMEVRFKEVVVADSSGRCCDGGHDGKRKDKLIINRDTHPQLFQLFRNISDRLVSELGNKDLIPCLAIGLLSKVEIVITPTPSFSGQFSDLPFQDPSVKEVLAAIFAVLAFLALLIGFIYGVATSGAVVAPTAGSGTPPGAGISATTSCCSPEQYVAIFVAIAMSVAAAITGTADFPDDPIRRGQLNTPPGPSEVTVKEGLELALSYPEPIIPGRPYAVGAKWSYTRETQLPGGVTAIYNHSVDEIRRNTQLLSRYEVEHADVVRVYRKESFIVSARFFAADASGEGKERQFQGGELFVQCYLEGTVSLQGRVYKFLLQDDGRDQDVANDGTYRGRFQFGPEDMGQWHVTVVAQNVNMATEDMTPEEAATHLGSMVLTHQLTITTSGGTCPYTPDGDVRVI